MQPTITVVEAELNNLMADSQGDGVNIFPGEEPEESETPTPGWGEQW